MAGRDGGLVKAIEDRLMAIVADTEDLTGFASLDRDFTPGSNIEDGEARLIVSVGSNRQTFLSCSTEFRVVSIAFAIYAPSAESLRAQADKLESVLDAWAENATDVSDEMDEDTSVRSMNIGDQTDRHDNTGQWALRVNTDWEIQLKRSQ